MNLILSCVIIVGCGAAAEWNIQSFLHGLQNSSTGDLNLLCHDGDGSVIFAIMSSLSIPSSPSTDLLNTVSTHKAVRDIVVGNETLSPNNAQVTTLTNKTLDALSSMIKLVALEQQHQHTKHRH